MRRTIRRLVNEFTDEIIECENGAKAFFAYRDNLPEWVFMDIEMPEKDGLTATKEICAAYPKACIVIVTNYSDEQMREAAAKAGACGYVVKENLLELRGIVGLQKAEN